MEVKGEFDCWDCEVYLYKKKSRTMSAIIGCLRMVRPLS